MGTVYLINKDSDRTYKNTNLFYIGKETFIIQKVCESE